MKEERSILIVEDNENDAELVLLAFRKVALERPLVRARDGAEALNYLFRREEHSSRRTAEPALVLLDIKMPRVDGFEVLHEMRASPVLKHVPVVMFSSSRHESDIRKAYELGANAYLVKALAFDEFTDAVADIARFWGLRNECAPARSRFARRL